MVGGLGCATTYRDLVDPAYPERYTDMANKEVNGFFAPQVLNGEVLDQTVWTWFFDTGTDKLNGAGIEQLAYIARRRPNPDPHVYLQAARVEEVGGYDPTRAEALVTARNELDAKRVASIQKFLTAQTAGRNIEFRIDIHDPSDPGINAISAANAVRDMQNRSRGGLTGGAGSSVSGGAGTAGLGGSSSQSGTGAPH
jgi:hypothetical protein